MPQNQRHLQTIPWPRRCKEVPETTEPPKGWASPAQGSEGSWRRRRGQCLGAEGRPTGPNSPLPNASSPLPQASHPPGSWSSVKVRSLGGGDGKTWDTPQDITPGELGPGWGLGPGWIGLAASDTGGEGKGPSHRGWGGSTVRQVPPLSRVWALSTSFPSFVPASPSAAALKILDAAESIWLQMESKNGLLPLVPTCRCQLCPGWAIRWLPSSTTHFLCGVSRRAINEQPETGLRKQIQPNKCSKQPLRPFSGQ